MILAIWRDKKDRSPKSDHKRCVCLTPGICWDTRLRTYFWVPISCVPLSISSANILSRTRGIIMKTHIERQAEVDALPTPNRTRQHGAALRLLLGLTVAATFLGLTLFRLEWHAIRAAIVEARSGPLLLGLASLTAGFAIRILRWWWMLRILEPGLPLRNCARPFLISLAINNTVPLRAGDILRRSDSATNCVLHPCAFWAHWSSNGCWTCLPSWPFSLRECSVSQPALFLPLYSEPAW